MKEWGNEMTEDEFDLLAATVLSGEATAEEKLRLEETLAQNAELRNEFADLRATWATLKEVGPLADAMNMSPAAPPAERLKEWQTAVEGQFGVVADRSEVLRRQEYGMEFAAVAAWLRGNVILVRWSVAVLCVALATVAAFLLSPRPSATAPSAPVAYVIAAKGGIELRRDGKAVAAGTGAALREADEIRLSSEASATVITATGTQSLRGPGTFAAADLSVGTNVNETNATARMARTALFQPSREMPGLLVTTRSSAGLPVYSPAGFTADLTPLILWKSQPGKTYDVAISDEFSPATAPFRQTAVVSPLAFTNAWPGRALASDGLYRLRITESGNPIVASEITFRTLPQANRTLSIDPAENLSAAYQMLVADPPRFGDALAILLTSPPKSAESELALRLKLVAFGRLGYQEDFGFTLARLETTK